MGRKSRRTRKLLIQTTLLLFVCLIISVAFYLFQLQSIERQAVPAFSEKESQVTKVAVKKAPESSFLEKKTDVHKYEQSGTHKPITVTFTGDVLLDRSVGQLIEAYGVDYPFIQVGDTLRNSDITAINLETSVSTRGIPSDKQFTFRSEPKTLQGLVNSGVDVVSLANNHTLDYGLDALRDTFDHLKSYNIAYTGAGNNEEEAFSAFYKEVNGKKIAIIGISRVLPEVSWGAKEDQPGIASGYQNEPMMTYIKKVADQSDYLMIMIHWNRERQDYPESYAREMGKAFIDAGASAVIGSHSHSLMGIEEYKGCPIYYSLGNFIFTESASPKGSETMIVQVTLDNGEISSSLKPAKIVKGQPQFMDENYNQAIISKLNQLSYNVKIDGKGAVSYLQ
ncbi:CapA family protein [Peribacillus sp. JNUCC 23]|uniref:CapA family protein n=1 Tax=Peribacillus sp. NPDC096379 TaxID=3364393 RepID=UPI003802335A